MASYFVDFTVGDEGNSGLSALLPVKYFVGMASSTSGITLSAGDRMDGKRGETWRETLTVPSSGSAGNLITFGAYGTAGSTELSGWISMPDTWFTAYEPSASFASELDDGATRNYRMALAANASSYAGTKIRVTYFASAGNAGGIAGASVGESTANDDFDAAPHRLTFSGANTATVSANSSLVSDEVNFTFDKTKRHLFHLYTTNRHFKSATLGSNFFYSTAVDDTMNAGAVTYSATSAWVGIGKIEVGIAGTANVYYIALGGLPSSVLFGGVAGTLKDSLVSLSANNDYFYDSTAFRLYIYSDSDPAAKTITHPEANPIITGSDLITADWTQDSANVWKSPLTTEPTIVYFNGVRGTVVAAKENITSEFKWNWASNVLYVWAPSDADPSGFYTSPGIEAGSRANAIRTNDKEYITIENLTVRDGNGSETQNINVGSDSVIGITIQDCVIERSGADGITLKGAVTAGSVTIDRCTIRNNGMWAIQNYSYNYTTGKIRNNVVYGNGIDSIKNNNPAGGIFGKLGNFEVSGNICYGQCPNGVYLAQTGHGIYHYNDTNVADIHDNVCYSNLNGAGIKIRGSVNIYRNTLYGNSAAGLSLGGNLTDDVVYSVWQNLVYGNNIAGTTNSGIHEMIKGTGSISLSLYNNVIYNNSGSTMVELQITDDLDVLNVKNNTFITVGTRRTVAIVAQTGTVAINNNLHWRADGNPNIMYDGASKTWAEWQALGYDINGLVADPLVVSVATPDFRLTATSPCRDAGVDVGLETDFVGRAVPKGSAPDIGAYEYAGGVAQQVAVIRMRRCR